MRVGLTLVFLMAACSDNAKSSADAGLPDLFAADLPGPGPGRTCDDPIDLTHQRTPLPASTVGGISQTSSLCDNQSDQAPEMFFTYDAGPTPVDIIVDVVVDPQKPWDALVTSRTSCTDLNSEEFCADNGDSQHLEVLGATGVFAIVVDGTSVYNGASQGKFTIAAHPRTIVAVGDACDEKGVANRCGGESFCQAGKCVATSAQSECAAATDLSAALAATGSTVVNGVMMPYEPGYYMGSCAFDGVPDDPERIYQITVSAPSMLDASTDDPNGTDFDTLLYLVKDSCNGVELGCADDVNTDQGQFRSHLIRELDPGTYFLFVDISSAALYGAFDSELRRYRITVTLTPDSVDGGSTDL